MESVNDRSYSRYVPGWLVALVMLGTAWGAPWPQFRGLERAGVTDETELLDRWPDPGPRVVWQRPIGCGFSGLALAEGRLFTMYGSEVDGKRQEVAAAFDPATGDELWRAPLGIEFEDEFGNGPRATPTVTEELTYCLGASGRLVALTTEDGTERWAVPLGETFGTRTPRWGFSGSPLVEGDLLLAEVGGGPGKAFAALDRHTGEVRWECQDGAIGYSSPLGVTLGGQRQVVFMHRGGRVVSLGLGGGELWAHTFAERAEIITMPVPVPPDRLFFSAPNRAGALLLRVTRGEEGWATEEVWREARMRTHWSTAVVYRGQVYGFDNAALKCLDLATGTLGWRQRGLGKGSLVVGDGKLVILTDEGALVLARASPERYEELGRIQLLEGRSWTGPTLVAGRVYVRNHTAMACVDLRSASGGGATDE